MVMEIEHLRRGLEQYAANKSNSAVSRRATAFIAKSLEANMILVGENIPDALPLPDAELPDAISGDNLRNMRLGVPLTQAELAAASHVSIATIRNLERGSPTKGRPATLRKLAAALRPQASSGV